MSDVKSSDDKDVIYTATRTSEGFIELTSLEMLDQLVGGFIQPEAAYFQLDDDSSSASPKITEV